MGLLLFPLTIIGVIEIKFTSSFPKMAAATPVIIAAKAQQTATLIFLHGLGDTGHGWATSMSEIRQPNMKVICPTAPTMPVSLNNGFQMPSWFDLKSLEATGPEDEVGIKKATDTIHSIIEEEEKAGIPSNKIVIGGFSQGGALALYSALTYAKPLGGVMALSCWLPLHKTFPGALNAANKDTPIFQAHGDCDPLVPYKWGQLTASVLKSIATNTEFHTYRGLMHSSSDTEMKDLRDFMERVLPSK